ncbi:MAG: phosphoribosylglycinamide formyltransferase [Flavobacteriaceae bacterium]|nr:phosphoribosylglycinamide formyltransferase [Flavobacteriaceae bacterium]|tara:strand:- start:402271 stop:402840 length:570 start_codon:yes stop_codon:yes gene_type:complete
MKRIVIFASGSGSNAENIINYFSNRNTAEVRMVLSNRSRAGVFERCKRLNIPCQHFKKSDFFESNTVLELLQKEADFIVLAGFLLKIPENIIKAYPNEIVNIHPALLPKYGGKGMYGMNVHRAIKENNEPETGITIHYVNEHYDEGGIIFQAKTAVEESDTPESIAQKVHELEYAHFPRVIEETIAKHA